MTYLFFNGAPASFHLPTALHDEVLAKKLRTLDKTLVIFGLNVKFTRKAIKAYSLAGYKPAHFPLFAREFQQWVETCSTRDLHAATADVSRIAIELPYQRRGRYSESGTYLSPLSDVDGPKCFVIVNRAATSADDVGGEQDDNAQKRTEGSRNDDGAEADQQTEHDENGQDEDQRDDGSSRNDASASTGARERSNDFHPGFSAKMTENEAKDAANAAATLEVKFDSVARRYANFQLGDKQRVKGFVEKHVPVKRGDYSGVLAQIVRGEPGGYVITGPTGCGKSTVALLPLFKNDTTVLVVEPTQANAANIYHEFTNVLPAMYASGVIFMPVPSAQFVAPTVSKPPFKQLQITTTDKLIEFFEHNGTLPKVDYLVLDEFHLPIRPMVFCVELLRTFDLVGKYVLVSATAPGFQVNPQLPRAVTKVEGQVPLGVLPSQIEGSDLDPRRWKRRGDGTVGVVVPSLEMANKLAMTYRQWKLRVFLVTRNTLVTEYVKAAANYRPGVVFVIEPAVEAGITLAMSVLVSLGATTAIRYDGKVVVEDTQPLDYLSSIQRGSRGGRIIPTLYITPATKVAVPPSNSADYYRAQAMIKMVAAGAKISHMRDNGIFSTFPKLTTLSRSLANAAISDEKDPFVALYKRNESGLLYCECGGTGKGFDKLAERELYLYLYDDGFFVAPVADFSDLASEPNQFVLRSSQLIAADAVVTAVGVRDKFSLGDLVTMTINKFSCYVNDLFDSMAAVFSGAKPESFSLSGDNNTHPEIRHFLRDAPEILRLFEYMQTEPRGVSYVWKKAKINGKCRSEHSFHYGTKSLNFSFPEKYSDNGLLDTRKLSKAVFDTLKGVLAIEILQNGAPDRCVNLNDYKGRVSTEHKWFRRNVLKA